MMVFRCIFWSESDTFPLASSEVLTVSDPTPAPSLPEALSEGASKLVMMPGERMSVTPSSREESSPSER